MSAATPATPATTPTAELRLSLIARIAECEDPLRLLTVRAVLDEEAERYDDTGARAFADAEVSTGEAPAPRSGGLVGDDDVIGYRPDGTPVRPREAVKRWDDAVADVLAGNGMTGEEAMARIRARVLGA